MSKIKLLDCTLRDGGYINDWKFGYLTIKSLIHKLIESDVDYIEVGFLRNCKYDKNSAVFNNCEEIEKVLPVNRGNACFTAMVLHNKYDLSQLELYDGKTIDALRITFHDYDIDEGLEYIQKAMNKGYKVFANPINIMGYSDIQILQLLKKINRIKPYAFSIVDTFGSMMKDDLLRIYSMIEHNLDKSIVIGLHLHENLALSFSLAQEFITMKSSERKCIIDASLFGMGRAPGNLCMELIMDYMNKKQGSDYNLNPILDSIDDYIVQLKKIEPWGYNTAYALSAQYNLHRNYAEFLLEKGRLRAKQINQILSAVDENKKTAYDEVYAEELYQRFQNIKVDDKKIIKEWQNKLADRDVLILAPGASVENEKDKVISFITEKMPIVIAANFAPENFKYDFIFCSNAMRYEALGKKKNQDILYLTSNLADVCGKEGNMINFTELSFDRLGNCDNCVIMLIKLLIGMGKKRVYIAGFDGYRDNHINYVSGYLISQHTKGQKENIKICEYVMNLKEKISLIFITESIYDK